ncbi:MAG: phosphate acetyltransferase [Oscillospiraceae bacterium]
MIDILKGKNVKLVFTEGEDLRIQQAAQKLLEEKLALPVLLGSLSAIEETSKTGGTNLEGMEIIDPTNYDKFDEMVEKMTELRKGKMDAAQCAEALKKANYFGTMLVKMGYAQGLLGGATYSTADTVRPALQLVKTRPGVSIVSSCFIMNREEAGKAERYVMADCAINLDPNEDELVEITQETAKAARLFDVDPKVALLSFSSKGSGKGPGVEKMQNATAKLKALDLDFPVDGELQFDAAFVPAVGQSKAPGSEVAGYANTFIFPDINSGNIGYKIAQRLGSFEAFGPILMGLNAPINDLSRGCNADEVYKMGIITAASAL